MEPLAFTTARGSTYVVTFREGGRSIDVARLSDHPVRWASLDRGTSFVARYTSLEFVAGPRGLQAQFKNVEDPEATFLTSPITDVVQVRSSVVS